MTEEQKDYRAFYYDKLLPIVSGLGYDVSTSPDEFIETKLRYLAHEILLFLGDPLPDSAEPE